MRFRVGALALVALGLTSGRAAAASTCDAQQDPERIRTHLERAKRVLASRDTSAWDSSLIEARRRNLGALRRYTEAEVFPRNITEPGRLVPVFVDGEGRDCAVAHLIRASGAGALVDEIAAHDNNAYLHDLSDARLEAWIATSGLSRHELAWIQPEYCGMVCSPPGDNACSSSYCSGGDPISQTPGHCVDVVEEDGTPCGPGGGECGRGACRDGYCEYECDEGCSAAGGGDGGWAPLIVALLLARRRRRAP